MNAQQAGHELIDLRFARRLAIATMDHAPDEVAFQRGRHLFIQTQAAIEECCEAIRATEREGVHP